MTNLVLLLSSAFLLVGAMPSALTQVRGPLADENRPAGELVDLLWSSDHAQRRAAKRRLLKVGPDAIPVLLSLLEDIRANPRKRRFATGREGEAHQALDRYQDYPPEDLYDLEITGRLKDDTAELLGQLHAVDAVPILIELMRRQVAADWPRGLDRVMRSLAQIGPPAVPALMQEIENAPSKAHSVVLRDENSSSESGDRDEENNQWDVSREVAIIRIRAVLVLGEIGDERALPAIERLLHPTSGPIPLEVESAYVTHAIERIWEKLRSRH